MDPKREHEARIAGLISRLDQLALSPTTQARLRQRLRIGAEGPPPEALPDLDLLDGKIALGKRQGSPWAYMGPLYRQRYAADPTPSSAADMLSWAFLHAQPREVDQVLEELAEAPLAFYSQLAPEIRVTLHSRTWGLPRGERLREALSRIAGHHSLTAEEHFLAFMLLSRSGEALAAYRYFCDQQTQILGGASEVGGRIPYRQATAYLHGARAAIQCGEGEEDAERWLAEIPRTAAEFEEASELRLVLKTRPQLVMHSEWGELLSRQRSSDERLKLLAAFLQEVQGSEPKNIQRRRLVLDSLLKDWQRWFPDQGSWPGLARTLAQQAPLAGRLPHFLQFFRDQTFALHDPQLDWAIWQPMARQEEIAPYWRAVAHLHRFLAFADGADESLAVAADILQTDPAWPPLHEWALHTVRKSRFISESRRQQLHRAIAVIAPPGRLAAQDIEAYLQHTEGPIPPGLVATWQRFAQGRQAISLEIALLRHSGTHGHYTNDALCRLWALACRARENDLAWRTASLLHARGALSDRVAFSWQASGENRRTYEFISPDKEEVAACLAGWTLDERRLCRATFVVGHRIPELLAVANPQLRVFKADHRGAGELEAPINSFLGSLPWLGQLARSYVLDPSQTLEHGFDMPFFAQALPANAWSFLVAKLLHHTGVGAFHGDVASLAEQVDRLTPRFGTTRQLRSHSSRVGKWLRSLTPEERSAWHELTHAARRVDPEVGRERLVAFSCRLATLMYPFHFQALTSLQLMRAELGIIRDLEQWLLSATYSEVRRRIGSAHRVPVPESLGSKAAARRVDDEIAMKGPS